MRNKCIQNTNIQTNTNQRRSQDSNLGWCKCWLYCYVYVKWSEMLFDIIAISLQGPNSQTKNFGNWEL